MNIFLPLLVTVLIAASCNSGTRGIFAKKTPHEAYAKKLDEQDLDKTPQGQAWLAASQKALSLPQPVDLPYRIEGYFHKDKPRAVGLQFAARAGQQLHFTLKKELGVNFVLYADLYQQQGNTAQHLLAIDTNQSQFVYTIPEGGTYILRIQPELERTGGFELAVAVGPSIAFPVSGTKARVGSVWGDARDGGKRPHEGIDIFAPKGTPAVAAADGRITAVKEGGIGGKTVWLRPEGASYTLYYAHLDEQLVQEGQAVKKGNIVGKVGNTGNARTTPAHLHFGIYTMGGAVDPLPFVDKEMKIPSALPEKKLETYLTLVKPWKDEDGQSYKEKTKLVPLAVSAKGYLAELPNERLILIPFSFVQISKEVPRPSTGIVTKAPESGRKT